MENEFDAYSDDQAYSNLGTERRSRGEMLKELRLRYATFVEDPPRKEYAWKVLDRERVALKEYLYNLFLKDALAELKICFCTSCCSLLVSKETMADLHGIDVTICGYENVSNFLRHADCLQNIRPETNFALYYTKEDLINTEYRESLFCHAYKPDNHASKWLQDAFCGGKFGFFKKLNENFNRIKQKNPPKTYFVSRLVIEEKIEHIFDTRSSDRRYFWGLLESDYGSCFIDAYCGAVDASGIEATGGSLVQFSHLLNDFDHIRGI